MISWLSFLIGITCVTNKVIASLIKWISYQSTSFASHMLNLNYIILTEIHSTKIIYFHKFDFFKIKKSAFLNKRLTFLFIA